ncbi:uncharacterized protein RSE6_04726 [Rhynchosporium secalis]|uniref:Uncharacterized protein n=1 Tax=Rhynchosporium secalis TaxID=38038 RepID=A0A1E1M612_RHYSE|nr:uncharacterized protein RSE6_04726 [Rhynchosporium secalis]
MIASSAPDAASSSKCSDSSSKPPSGSSSEVAIRHHTNWCKEWTNHPRYTCLRLLFGWTLINYSWVACRHDKCKECVEMTEARWAERFPY